MFAEPRLLSERSQEEATNAQGNRSKREHGVAEQSKPKEQGDISNVLGIAGVPIRARCNELAAEALRCFGPQLTNTPQREGGTAEGEQATRST